MNSKEPIMIDGVDILKEKINMCFILLLNKLETPETIEQTIYEHLDAFVKEWNDELVHKTQECEKLLKENQQLRNSLSDSLMFKFTGQENETNRYRKALEEIEGLVKNFCKDCDDYEDCNWEKEGCYYSLIPNLKDIINKAKGEGDEDT